MEREQGSIIPLTYKRLVSMKTKFPRSNVPYPDMDPQRSVIIWSQGFGSGSKIIDFGSGSGFSNFIPKISVQMNNER